ncbi:hypothetical protein GCM10010279_02420 [Streptomyces mutabilis]|nr:hypothetical protein GCM10010279_02420 [Streptomyces mutabilis]
MDELRSTVQEVRTTILALRRPPAGPPTGLRGRVLRETASAAARLGFPPSTHCTGAVDTRVPDRSGDGLLTALRQALSDTAGRPGVTRRGTVLPRACSKRRARRRSRRRRPAPSPPRTVHCPDPGVVTRPVGRCTNRAAGPPRPDRDPVPRYGPSADGGCVTLRTSAGDRHGRTRR